MKEKSFWADPSPRTKTFPKRPCNKSMRRYGALSTANTGLRASLSKITATRSKRWRRRGWSGRRSTLIKWAISWKAVHRVRRSHPRILKRRLRPRVAHRRPSPRRQRGKRNEHRALIAIRQEISAETHSCGLENSERVRLRPHPLHFETSIL